MSQDDTLERFDVSRRRLVQSLGLTGAVGLAGCGGGGGTDTPTDGEDTPTPTDTTPTPAQEEWTEGGELIATFGADVKNTDPVQANDTTSSKATGLIYETLMATDFGGTPQPYLAESVEQTDEDLTWRIKLREGIQFTHGTELTTEDVQFTFERYEGTPRESDVFLWYDSSEIVDDYTIDVKLSQQYAPFKFSLGGIPIVPKEAGEDGDVDLSEEPVGTGPYKFGEHDPDSLWRIEHNEDHWFEGSDDFPETPPIETITFRVITEQSAQIAALEAGDVDFIGDVQAESYSDLKDNDTFTVTERTAGGFDMFIFPLASEPFDNRKVRRGIARLIPREAIVDTVYQGIGTPAYAPISPLAGAFTSPEFQAEMGDKYHRYNVDKATSLLEEGFNELGIEKPYETKIITNENPQRVKWSQLIQESLNNTDFFECGLEQFEWNTYVGKILSEDSHKLDAMISLGWSAGWDPDAYVNYLFHSRQFSPACCNISHYENEEVDNLIDEGLQTYDIEERKQIYTECQEKIVRDTPMAFIRFGKAMDAFHSDTVKNFNTYPIDGGEYSGIYASYAGKFTWVEK